MAKLGLKKPENFDLRSFLRRAIWMFMALLFIVTGLGVGVYAFWVNTHPSKTDVAQQAKVCNISPVTTQKVLPAPEAFKTSGKAAKLEITDLQPGSGVASQIGDCLTVKYYGSLAKNGQKFDEDFTTPTALKFKVGGGQVIQGWDEGLVGMKVGGLRRIVIPAALGYGSQAQSTIPANSDLVFEVYLLAIE